MQRTESQELMAKATPGDSVFDAVSAPAGHPSLLIVGTGQDVTLTPPLQASADASFT